MAIPAFTGLETALRGLTAAQAAIDTTGENIANASNPNYSRQVVNLTESTPLDLPAFSSVTGGGVQLGTGVDVTTITRARDQFLDVQYRAQNANANATSTTAGLLGQVQTALAEPTSSGLSAQLNNFFNAWSDLANAPTSAGAPQSVIDSATSLADTFNGIENQLQTLQGQMQAQYQTLTSDTGPVYTDAASIAQLNGQISNALAAGQTPNDLLDQRDALLDDLSKYGTVSVTTPSTLPNGEIQVNFGGDTTTPLVSGTATPPPVSSLTLTGATASSPGSGGSLGSLLTLTGPANANNQPPSIAGYLGQLGSFASTLEASIENPAPGVTFTNGSDPKGTNPQHFFDVVAGANGTVSLQLDPGVTASTLQASSAPSTAPGVTDIASAIAQAGGAATQSYTAFVSGVGSDVQAAQSAQTTQQSLLTAIGNQRQSVSGVSLDEEMANLIQEQQAYQASARVMNAVDATLNTLINQVGAGL